LEQALRSSGIRQFIAIRRRNIVASLLGPAYGFINSPSDVLKEHFAKLAEQVVAVVRAG
jgi:hypothetical protein